MFSILHDSIFNPKNLVKQVNRSGWFIFLYMAILALFMSLGQIMVFVRYENSTFTYENTGCELVEGEVVCDGDNYNPTNLFNIYGIRTYVLASDTDFAEVSVSSQVAFVIQDDSLSLYYGNSSLVSAKLASLGTNITTIEDAVAAYADEVFYTGLLSSYLNNLLIITLIILISSLMFIRFRKEIKYTKLFKLTAVAVTPIALLITFYNIIYFNDWIFFTLGFFAYMPMFKLSRELLYQSMLRKYQEQNPDGVVESYTPEDFEDENEDEEERDDDKN